MQYADYWIASTVLDDAANSASTIMAAPVIQQNADP
jgi:hypothetical protein